LSCLFLVTASRMRACARDTASRLCVRTVLCSPAFSLAPPLRSTGSAAAVAALFARFLATSGRSDFSVALIVGYGLRPSRQRPGHDWRRHVSHIIDTGHVAFCGTENIGTPNLSYAAQYLACALPCERFTSDLADSPCITRGRCGSLHLHRDGLPPSTFCRSPGAPVHSITSGLMHRSNCVFAVGTRVTPAPKGACTFGARKIT
jgi:hypothetical protein